MPFGVVSGVGRGMSVFDGVEIVEREWPVLEVNAGHPIATSGGFCGVVMLCREGWRRGSSQITLGFLA